VEALAPAVENGKRQGGDLWAQAGRAQIALPVERLRRSPASAEAVAIGALRVMGAWYMTWRPVWWK
jgi:hypothetical protein